MIISALLLYLFIFVVLFAATLLGLVVHIISGADLALGTWAALALFVVAGVLIRITGPTGPVFGRCWHFRSRLIGSGDGKRWCVDCWKLKQSEKDNA